MNPKLITVFYLFLFGSCCTGTGAPSPLSYVVQGWDSECFFLMRSSFEGKKFLGIGTCYQIKEDGTFEKMWQIEGDYSYEGRIFLGGEGKILIRILEASQPQPDPENSRLSQQVILEFYNEGKSFKKVSVREVVDASKLVYNSFRIFSTHQIFKYEDATAPKMGRMLDFDFFDDEDKETMRKTIKDETEIFCIKTVQAEILVFTVADGTLIYRKKVK
jgi:hypothetical protein